MEERSLYEQAIDRSDTFIWKTHINMGYYTHFHAAIEMYFLLDGCMEAEINGRLYQLKAGDISVANPFELHRYIRIGNAPVAVLIIGSQYLNDFEFVYGNKILPNHLPDAQFNREILNILQQIPYSFENANLSFLAKKAYTDLVLDKITSHYGLKAPEISQNKIREIIEYIYKNYTQKITLETLSDHFHYTRTSLSRLLSQYLKVDLRTFLNTLRVEQAELMICDPKYKHLSILQIATLCGFDSATTFYRAYKRCYKSTPPLHSTATGRNDLFQPNSRISLLEYSPSA